MKNTGNLFPSGDKEDEFEKVIENIELKELNSNLASGNSFSVNFKNR